ncbi:MAG: L-serine ammonia-lyase [Clostridia bacterium]|nr:L-serine ammonia-lyase [Clostridia bacterium]
MYSLTEVYKIGRGPSSSHSMGPEFATNDFLKRYPAAARYEVTLYGSLALTGKGHLTDDAVLSVFKDRRAEVKFDPAKKDLPHPNTMTFAAYSENGAKIGEVTYLSIGGGNITVLGETNSEKSVYPFRNFSDWKRYCHDNSIPLYEGAYRFEPNIRKHLERVWQAMQEAVRRGVAAEGALPGRLHVMRKAKRLFSPVKGELNEDKEKRMIACYAYAVAEENAGGGTIVTAPTCGACGVLPALLVYFKERDNFPDEKIIDALAVAGMIGSVIKTNASVSGAEAGCQAEIGTATAMAAAAASTLFDSNPEEVEYAAEIALEHQLGLTCDPVEGYVQIPCIERNAVAAMRALDSARIAKLLCGTRRISFDLIVQTMYETGKDINARYRETSEGGLAANYKGC